MRLWRRAVQRLLAVSTTILLTACTALPRLEAVPAELTEQAVIEGVPNVRIWPDQDLTPLLRSILVNREREVTALRMVNLPTDHLPPASLLAISGGGDAGSYCSGVLSGWTARGDRPVFKVVTGVSVGALIAPFAFLGSNYDDVVRTVATTAVAEDFVQERGTFVGLLSDGMGSTEPMAKLVSRYLTTDVLRAVAAEYSKGRLLFIATTDLDAGRQVVWNMGEIASSPALNALDLFRKIMVASASIPGVMSPVLIDVVVNGKHYQEMHVDGGIVAQVFLSPVAFLNQLQLATGQERETHIYIVRNGRLQPDWSNTQRRTLDIGNRAILALVEAQGVHDVYRLYETAMEDHADFNVAYIGAEFEYPHSREFDSQYMKKLYDYGFNQAFSGSEWRKAPPMPRRPALQELMPMQWSATAER